METSTSPYYSSNTSSPGSHHVYVEVNDADNNTAKTLTVEFDVMQSPSSSGTSSPSTTHQPAPSPSVPELPSLIIGPFMLTMLAGTIVYEQRLKKIGS